MRRLLADSNAAAGWPLNWTFARLDNWRYASWDRTDDEFRQLAHLWRDGGRLVGFTILEGPDDWYALIHLTAGSPLSSRPLSTKEAAERQAAEFRAALGI